MELLGSPAYVTHTSSCRMQHVLIRARSIKSDGILETFISINVKVSVSTPSMNGNRVARSSFLVRAAHIYGAQQMAVEKHSTLYLSSNMNHGYIYG